MANESVATPVEQAVEEPFFWEEDAYERIANRTRGLQAMACLAGVELEETDNVAPKVWGGIWQFVGQVMDDIERDARILWKRGK